MRWSSILEPSTVYEMLAQEGVTFYTGVPDSLLKHFCAYVTDTTDQDAHVITHNEGGAIALAAGHHLATGDVPLVYMQNSGQGNAVNPLTSLADPEVYSIPMILMIGWRGEPGSDDEPQHVKQGRITQPLLDALEIPHAVLPLTDHEAKRTIQEAVETAEKQDRPFALLARRGTFEPYRLEDEGQARHELSREEAIVEVAGKAPDEAAFVSTTGKTSRELFEHRARADQRHAQDFLTVGSMGHVSQIALGVAEQAPETSVWCLDGDGSIIMHMGTLAIIGQRAPANFKHVVINNNAHDSVGGQPTAGFHIDIPRVAEACGYTATWQAGTLKELREHLDRLERSQGPALLEVRVRKGAREDLGRPTVPTLERKEAFMAFLEGR